MQHCFDEEVAEGEGHRSYQSLAPVAAPVDVDLRQVPQDVIVEHRHHRGIQRNVAGDQHPEVESIGDEGPEVEQRLEAERGGRQDREQGDTRTVYLVRHCPYHYVREEGETHYAAVHQTILTVFYFMLPCYK